MVHVSVEATYPMKVFNQSTQTKITLLTNIGLILVVGLLVGLSLNQTRTSNERIKEASAHMLAEAARLTLQPQSRAQALQIQRSFTRTHEYGQGLANHLFYLRERANHGELNAESLRAERTSELRKALEQRPDLLGLYLIFQPDALGGRDSDFRGRNDLGSNDAGRFSV